MTKIEESEMRVLEDTKDHFSAWIRPRMATAREIDEAMRKSGADVIGTFQGVNFIQEKRRQ